MAKIKDLGGQIMSKDTDETRNVVKGIFMKTRFSMEKTRGK